MIIVTNGKHGILREKISRGIKYWSSVRDLNLRGLAHRINCRVDYLEKVVNCEPVDIPLESLQNVVMALNPPGGRILSLEDTPDILTLEDCLSQLEVPAPHQEKLFELDN